MRYIPRLVRSSPDPEGDDVSDSHAFFDRPILNSPYEYPARHWELDESGQPTQNVVEKRRPAESCEETPRLCRGGSRSLTIPAVERRTPSREPPRHHKRESVMTYGRLSHTKWECKYHVVFIPKYRREVLFGQLRRELGEVFRQLAEQKESRIEEGHMMRDHVHMLVSIPPKYSVAQVVGYIKGKSAIHVARNYGERRRNFVGQHFWARGYFVSTVGRDEAVIRQYITHQEAEDRRIDQLGLDLGSRPL